MNKLFSIATFLLLLLATTNVVFSQITVDIPCTGTTNPNSGRIDLVNNTKSYGFLYSGVTNQYKGWARFNVSSYIPANATITSATAIFWVETSSGSGTGNYLKLFTGDPGSMTVSALSTAIGGSSGAHSGGSDDYHPTGQKSIAINATGITFLNNNKTVALNLGFTKPSGNFGFRIYGSDGAANGTADANKKPILRVTYTLPCSAPTVAATTAASSIGCTTATTGGNVTDDGGCAVTERGVVYAISPTVPTTVNSKVTATGTTGTFTSSLTGLTANTTYIVRAYATNINGTTYGTEISFTTLPPPGQPTAITPTTACANTATTFTTTATNSPTSYTWTLPSGWTGSSSTASITATPNSTNGSISVTATNACGTSAVRTTAITLSVPVAPTVNTIANP